MSYTPANAAVLRAIAELSQAVVLWSDDRSGGVWCSETAKELLALPPEAVASNWAGDLGLVEEADREAVKQTRSSRNRARLQFRMARGDGAIALIDAVFAPAEEGDGYSNPRIAILRDITAAAQFEHDQGIFDELSREARFTNCRRTNTVHFGNGLKRVFGIDLTGVHPFPTPFVDHIHPDDRDHAFRDYYALVEGTQVSGEIQFRLRRGDGSYAMVRERFHPERDTSGKVIAIHSTVTDISEWHEERQRRDLLARVSGRLIIDYALKSNLLQYSGAVTETLGYAPEDMPQTIEGYLDLMHPDDRPVLLRALEAVHEGAVWSEPLELSYRLRRTDGSYAHILDRSLTIIDAGGRAEGGIIVQTDVSNLLRDREELRASHERLRVLAELSGAAVAELDVASGKIGWSGAVREQFGLAPEDMPQDLPGLYDMMQPDGRITHEAAFQALLRGEPWTTPLEMTFRARHKEGQLKHFVDRSACLLDEQGHIAKVLITIKDVTSLLRKQDRLLAITDIASDASFEYYPGEGRAVFNNGFERRFGLKLSGEHLQPFHLYDHVHPDDIERVQCAFTDFVNSDEPRFNVEYRLRRGNDGWATILQKTAALRDEFGQPTLIIGTIDDISEQRRTAARLHDAIEALDSGFALFDENQCLVLHNSRFAELNSGVADLIQPGVQRDELLEAMKARHLLLAPDKIPMSQAADGPKPVNAEITQANGALYDVRFNPTGSGDWVSLVTDVTEVVQDQKKLRAMFEVSADAMFDYDVPKATIALDRGFRTHFGYDWQGEYAVPSPFDYTVHPDDYPTVTQDRLEFIASRRTRFDVEYRMRRADGSWAYVAERAVALRDDTGKAIHILGAVADLTEQRMLEEQLHAAQKMESIGRISGGIAHDFNNLLAIIMGNAELLAMMADGTELRNCVEEIVSATKRGAELTKRLLSFARKSRLAPEPVNPNEMVTGMGQLIARVLPATIALQTSLQAGLWAIKVDPAFLESALLNLVINARDAMPKGGTLTIETANQRVTDDYGIERNEVIKPGRYVMLAVTDTGQGIPRDVIDRVVEPFFSTKGPHLGSGLGLSMVDGFVRQSGGLLRIYSEVGVGTTVKLLLPADLDDNSKGLGSSPKPQVTTVEDNLCILLVEDEPKVRAVVAHILQDAGLNVFQAESGDAALALYERMPQRPDVLLTDVVMPGTLQGPALARSLKERQPDLRIMFMSGYANEAAINGNGLRPDDVFLMKPIQRQSLLEEIARIARRSSSSTRRAVD